MTVTPLARRIATLSAGLAIAALALTGCSAATTDTAAGGSAQSKKEACAILSAELEDVATDLQTSLTDIATDPSSAVTALQGLADSFTAATEKVTNEEVKAAGVVASDAMNAFVDAADGAIDGGDPSTLNTAMTDFQTGTADIAALCA